MKKKIVWITGDWALDTDLPIVPYLRDMLKLDIKWYVICGHKSKTEIPENLIDGIYHLNYRYRSLNCARQYYSIFKEIKMNEADVIYSDNLGLPYYYAVLFAYKRRNIPVIHGAHNVIPYAVWPASLKWYVKFVFKFNNHFQLFSKFTAEYFKQHYPSKSMFYAPMTVKDFGPVSTDNYQVDSSKLNLLFFGNVVGNKRLDLLIDAIKSLPEEVQAKVHLNICGKCEEAGRYIQQIGGCPSISTFFKRIEDNEIAELFTKHDFLMLPYEDVAQSGPHMIAYNYDLPVIASDIEGFVERVEDGKNGFLFKRNDVGCLRETIVKASNLSSDNYRKMKDYLKEYTDQNFSVEKVASKYVDYFNTL